MLALSRLLQVKDNCKALGGRVRAAGTGGGAARGAPVLLHRRFALLGNQGKWPTTPRPCPQALGGCLGTAPIKLSCWPAGLQPLAATAPAIDKVQPNELCKPGAPAQQSAPWRCREGFLLFKEKS